MDIMKLMQQAQEMQGRLQQMQDELAQQTVTGTAGGGMVTVEADGQGTVRRVKIDPSVVVPDDVEMLEDLVIVAVADAQRRAAELQQSQMGGAHRRVGSAVQASVLISRGRSSCPRSTIWPPSCRSSRASAARRRCASRIIC